ncbi:MAG: protease complex subunit PrcB family protein [Flavobacteriaceae bacterium]|nr:protease complex subunit PrcB family protein [Flavobacteriaceae bacterium]
MKIIFYIVITVVLSTCPQKGIEQMAMKTIAKGELHGAGEEDIQKANLIINSNGDWNALVIQMNTVNKVSENFQELPIDFSKEMVVACFDQQRNTGGFGIEIKSIIEKDDKVLVVIERTAPGPTDFATMILTQPYHLVKIPLNDKEFEFIE